MIVDDPTTTRDEKRARELAEDIRDIWPTLDRFITIHEERGDTEALDRLMRALRRALNDATPKSELEEN